MGKRVTEEQKEAAFILHTQQGLSFTEISKKLGIASVTVSKIVKEKMEEVPEVQEAEKTVEDYLQMTIDAQKAHIESLERICLALAGGKGIA